MWWTQHKPPCLKSVVFLTDSNRWICFSGFVLLRFLLFANWILHIIFTAVCLFLLNLPAYLHSALTLKLSWLIIYKMKPWRIFAASDYIARFCPWLQPAAQIPVFILIMLIANKKQQNNSRVNVNGHECAYRLFCSVTPGDSRIAFNPWTLLIFPW